MCNPGRRYASNPFEDDGGEDGLRGLWAIAFNFLLWRSDIELVAGGGTYLTTICVFLVVDFVEEKNSEAL